MKLQAVLKNNSGLTLIEILVVIGIIAMLFAIGSFMDLSSISRGSIMSEQSTLVAILQKARNRAMNNIDASSHGVRLESDSFVIFRVSPLEEEIIMRNSNIEPSGLSEVIFDQLSGNTDDHGTIILKDVSGGLLAEVKVFENGLIKW